MVTCKRAEVKRVDYKRAEKLLKLLVDILGLISQPIKLRSEMRLTDSQLIRTQYLRNKILIFPVKETESDLIKNYFETIAVRGPASAAHATSYETIRLKMRPINPIRCFS